MPPSFRLVDYSLRPAKTVERKLLCDLFRRLEPFGHIHTYRYIGFGSIYFTDFQLFHRALGLSDMISIEKEITHEPRFDFNKPYRCVELKMGHSNVILPTLEWEKRCVIWLDYDGKLDKSVLADVATVVARARSGTIWIISLNSEAERKPGADPEELDAIRLQCFKENVGAENVPNDVSGCDLRAASIQKVYRRVLLNEVLKGLLDRNGPLPSAKKMRFNQLINFTYADDAQMMTIGGILYNEANEVELDKCKFGDLDFYRDGDDPCLIRAPKLTPKEIRFLNACLPKLHAVSPLALPGVPPSDVEDYAMIYRYYPSFVESFLG